MAHWVEHKGVDTLLIGVTDGDLAWDAVQGDFGRGERMLLPPVLTRRFATEPKWVALTAYRDGADSRDARFIELGADFAAAIHGTPKEDLLSQEVRQQRRALTLAWSAVATLFILAGLAGWQWKAALDAEHVAQRQRDRAVEAEGVALEQKRIAERNFGIAKQAADDVVFLGSTCQGVRSEAVRKILDTAQTMMDALVRAAPDDLELLRSRGAMLIEFAITYLTVGDQERAQAAADESLAIARRLATTDPANIRWQYDLSLSLYQFGEVRFEGGDRAGGLVAQHESLAIRRRLASAEPENAVAAHRPA